MIMRNGYEAARPPEERSRLGLKFKPQEQTPGHDDRDEFLKMSVPGERHAGQRRASSGVARQAGSRSDQEGDSLVTSACEDTFGLVSNFPQ